MFMFSKHRRAIDLLSLQIVFTYAEIPSTLREKMQFGRDIEFANLKNDLKMVST